MKTQTAYRFFGGSAGLRTHVFGKGEPLPEGYHATPEEAKSQWEEETRARFNDRNASRAEAEAKAEAIKAALVESKAALVESINTLEKEYSARISVALRPERLAPGLEIEVSAQGKLGAHVFIFEY